LAEQVLWAAPLRAALALQLREVELAPKSPRRGDIARSGTPAAAPAAVIAIVEEEMTSCKSGQRHIFKVNSENG
jgi:hypothetical protein